MDNLPLTRSLFRYYVTICFADVWCNIRTYSTHVHKVNFFLWDCITNERLETKRYVWSIVVFELAEERVFVWHQRGEKYQNFNNMNYCLYRCLGRTFDVLLHYSLLCSLPGKKLKEAVVDFWHVSNFYGETNIHFKLIFIVSFCLVLEE